MAGKIIATLLCCCWLGGDIFAQVEVTPTFRFKDGIYTTFEEFQRNQPSISWKDLETNLVTNPKTLLTQVEYLRFKQGQEVIDLEQIWGFSRGGVPYIRIPKDSINKPLSSFAALRLAGNICFFSYQTIIDKDLEVAAYNPLTGRPFRTATVQREVVVEREKILSFAIGEIRTFNSEQIQVLIADDPELIRILQTLSGEDVADQMFRLLLAYNRRHPVFFEP